MSTVKILSFNKTETISFFVKVGSTNKRLMSKVPGNSSPENTYINQYYKQLDENEQKTTTATTSVANYLFRIFKLLFFFATS